MPLFAAEPEKYPGSVHFPIYPCWGVDGNGADIGPCFMVNTDTGECVKCVWNEQRNGFKMDWEKGEAVRVTEVHPLPILFFPEKRGW